MIAAMAQKDRGIGFQGQLPWRLSADMAFFRASTMGHALLMGRKTYETLPSGQLEGRDLIVLSKQGFQPIATEGVVVENTLENGLVRARELSKGEDVFIAGGGEIYAEAKRQGIVDRMLLTFVEGEFESDVFFPEIDESNWQREEIVYVQSDEFNSHAFVIWEYQKIAD
jgi:dihydrofolate reductase